MGINILKKGKDGELELCKRLDPFFPNTLKRNLNQTREGGADVDGCHPFVIEVKRVQDTCIGNKNKWWKQVCRATVHEDEISVVAYRPNKAPWRYLLSASLVNPILQGWIEMGEDQFLQLVIDTFAIEAK